MKNLKINKKIGTICILSLVVGACKVPTLIQKAEGPTLPSAYQNASNDSSNIAQTKWKQYFKDPDLNQLIEVALQNNQELNITLQEIEIARNEIKARKGEYLPFVGLGGSAGIDKHGRYTNTGASEAERNIVPGKENPEPLPDFALGATASWEIDIWGKLHNAQKAAVKKYLATIDGKNFVITNLIAEIANSYYELIALDNQLEILQQNIEIQNNALHIVKLQKEAARATELAVRRFEAEVQKTTSMQFEVRQRITETENRINYLLGRYPQKIVRNSKNFFDTTIPQQIQAGLPAQLLSNRPDVRKAEQELAASKLDVKVAKARFYPSLGISANIGYNAFNTSYLIKTPQSLMYSLAADLAGPLINKNAIKAAYATANAQQIQAAFNYERSLLNAYIEVANQMAKINNLEQSYAYKTNQVNALTQSIDISNSLFRSARADYMEVLLTQRDALESKFDLVETRMQQLNAFVNIYKALGGGWN